MECNEIPSFHPNREVEKHDEEEDEWVEKQTNLDKPAGCNGNNEMKVFNQQCVIGFENSSVYAFRQCVHQCICEN